MAHVKAIFPVHRARMKMEPPAADWVVENGAGHYVKMVHNGIEYGDMPVICEAYSLLERDLELTADELHEIFVRLDKGDTGQLSYRNFEPHLR